MHWFIFCMFVQTAHSPPVNVLSESVVMLYCFDIRCWIWWLWSSSNTVTCLHAHGHWSWSSWTVNTSWKNLGGSPARAGARSPVWLRTVGLVSLCQHCCLSETRQSREYARYDVDTPSQIGWYRPLKSPRRNCLLLYEPQTLRGRACWHLGKCVRAANVMLVHLANDNKHMLVRSKCTYKFMLTLEKYPVIPKCILKCAHCQQLQTSVYSSS